MKLAYNLKKINPTGENTFTSLSCLGPCPIYCIFRLYNTIFVIFMIYIDIPKI